MDEQKTKDAAVIRNAFQKLSYGSVGLTCNCDDCRGWRREIEEALARLEGVDQTTPLISERPLFEFTAA